MTAKVRLIPMIPEASCSHKRQHRARNNLEIVENGQHPSGPGCPVAYQSISVRVPTNLVTEELPVAARGYTIKGGVAKSAIGAKKPQLYGNATCQKRWVRISFTASTCA